MSKNGKPSSKPSNAIETKTGGYLIPGQGGGPQPGSGRPTSVIRRASALAYAERIPKLAEIADGKCYVTIIQQCPECGFEGEKLTPEQFKGAVPTVGDIIRATDTLGKHGAVGRETAIPNHIVNELGGAVDAELPEIEGIDMDAVKERIYERWAVVLGRYASGGV